VIPAAGGGNRDDTVVAGFGAEWSTFDQSAMSEQERAELFAQYFTRFPWEELPASAVGADIGCGSGRWAGCVAPRVGTLHCVDPSAEALQVARRNLADQPRVEFHLGDVGKLPFAPASLDFAYSLGVLHHVPDTAKALRSCAGVLKAGAPFLVYIYYAFDNQPAWYRRLWALSDVVRRGVARMPFRARLAVTGLVASVVYLPLARLALLAERLGRDVTSMPLAYYRRRSFYVMRNDALDRFGTRLEQRFTREQILQMLEDAGFEHVLFNEGPPYWTAVATRRT
jgi:ubiquinone/menaquinone biosynthesis C-methylase UbiE